MKFRDFRGFEILFLIPCRTQSSDLFGSSQCWQVREISLANVTVLTRSQEYVVHVATIIAT